MRRLLRRSVGEVDVVAFPSLSIEKSDPPRCLLGRDTIEDSFAKGREQELLGTVDAVFLMMYFLLKVRL